MRTDVKLGVFLSMVIVLTLGGYFVYPRGGEAIPLAGDDKPLGGASSSAKYASNSQEASGRQKSAIPAKNARTARNNDNSKTRVPARRQNFLKKSSRLVEGASKTHALPVSGASLAAGTSKTASSQGRRDAATARRLGNAASKTATPRKAAKPGGQQHVASNVTEQPGTPTPPGLLAATRKKLTPQNQPAVDLHRVQPGDTFATLAQAYYGSVRHVEFLMKANPGIDPARMQIGATVRVPALMAKRNAATTPVSKEVKKTRAASAPIKTYTVRSGDSFYRIAEQQLGDAARWEELFELNKKTVGNDPSRLKVGQVLALPDK